MRMRMRGEGVLLRLRRKGLEARHQCYLPSRHQGSNGIRRRIQCHSFEPVMEPLFRGFHVFKLPDALFIFSSSFLSALKLLIQTS